MKRTIVLLLLALIAPAGCASRGAGGARRPDPTPSVLDEAETIERANKDNRAIFEGLETATSPPTSPAEASVNEVSKRGGANCSTIAEATDRLRDEQTRVEDLADELAAARRRAADLEDDLEAERHKGAVWTWMLIAGGAALVASAVLLVTAGWKWAVPVAVVGGGLVAVGALMPTVIRLVEIGLWAVGGLVVVVLVWVAIARRKQLADVVRGNEAAKTLLPDELRRRIYGDGTGGEPVGVMAATMGEDAKRAVKAARGR